MLFTNEGGQQGIFRRAEELGEAGFDEGHDVDEPDGFGCLRQEKDEDNGRLHETGDNP